jgi:hypothetical protein
MKKYHEGFPLIEIMIIIAVTYLRRSSATPFGGGAGAGYFHAVGPDGRVAAPEGLQGFVLLLGGDQAVILVRKNGLFFGYPLRTLMSKAES